MALVAGLGVGGRAMLRPSLPELPLGAVTRGDWIDRIDIRGEIRPLKSVNIVAPSQAGDLLVVELVKSGTQVEKGDKIATFNPIVLRQQIQDKQNELRQADAEIERSKASAKIQDDQNQTQLLRGKFDIERAKLSLGSERLVARLDYEKAKLDVVNAEQRYLEIEKRREANQASSAADVASRGRQREKVQDELTRLQESLQAMDVFAPATGTVHLMPNGRGAGPGPMMGPPPEFRQGDRVWSGAAIAELPDMSAVFVRAQLDEDSRGRLKLAQPALVRVDAIPDRELAASVSDISILARVDFNTGFPPPRNFDVKVQVQDVDPRLRPGMSATARIEVDRLPKALLVPAHAVFDVNGRAVVYKVERSAFVETPIDVVKRNRDQIAVGSGLKEGDQVTMSQPPAKFIKKAN